MTNLNKMFYGVLQQSINEKILDTDICWFCNRPEAARETAAFIYLYRNFSTSFMVFYNRHKWEELTCQLPCCPVCKMAHGKAEIWSKNLGTIGLFSGMLIGPAFGLLMMYFVFVVLNYDPADFGKLLNAFLIVMLAAGVISGFFVGRWYGKKLVYSSFTDSMPIDFAKKHPSIAALLANGWKFGKPDVGQR